MKVIRTYRLRKQAEEAANFLMSKGIAASIEGNDVINNFKSIDVAPSHIELKVQDRFVDRAEQFLMEKENNASLNLPKFNFLGFLKK